jgi:hypothetical protein
MENPAEKPVWKQASDCQDVAFFMLNNLIYFCDKLIRDFLDVIMLAFAFIL